MTKETFQYSGITASKVRHHRITDNHLYGEKYYIEPFQSFNKLHIF